jgi:putative pyruvate formate lyase activating enzyme
MGTAIQSREEFSVGYRSLFESGKLASRGEIALRKPGDCALCPRDCHIDRLSGKSAACCTGRHARVSSYCAHFGEEDCLRGTRGSGTIFFSGCNLRCVFCQNFEISCQAGGEDTSPEKLARMMLALQERGCHNINLVTPEHVVPQILEAL